jgi:hypothetical protein
VADSEQPNPQPNSERPNPERLDPAQQDSVLQDIALVLAHNLPPGWQECLAVHSALGAHAETAVRIERLNGPPADVEGPEVLGELFARLRAGMYRNGIGTWFTARYRLTHPVDYQVEYDTAGQPDWSMPPPPEAYDDELRTFPRDAEHTPDWLRRPAGRFQMARVFDSLGPGQTPRFDRPPVPDDEVEAVADYLTKASMVLAARSLDNDLLDPARPEKVPLTYLTDGTWIWPGGVGYYLRTHGVPPEPELVEHIRSQGYQPPEVDDHTRDVAVATIMGQPPPSRRAPAPPRQPAAQPPGATPRGPASDPRPPGPDARAPAGRASLPQGAPEPLEGAATAGGGADARPEPAADAGTGGVGGDDGVGGDGGDGGDGERRVPDGGADPGPGDEPAAGEELPAPGDPLVSKLDPGALELHAPPPPPDGPDAAALGRLRDRLAEAGADPATYGIETVVDGAWCLVRAGGGWAVFREAGGEQAERVVFPSAGQAAAYLLGSLLMAGRKAVAAPPRTYEGAIEPLPGEPPFTLFRNLRELELASGTEIDRIGDPAGNLAYAAGTHYSQRSLPAEWADRPYHVYRVVRPLRVLIGTAIPWFDQPGGGTGYFLPVSVGELLGDGVLAEIEAPPK